jgi:hypothetical protein
MLPNLIHSATAAVIACGLLGAAVSSVIIGSPAMARETAVAPEKNPPGDIPDDQVFIQYKSPLGFSFKVPEGWARVERADGVRFSDKYNTIDLTVAKADQAPSAAAVKTREIAGLPMADHAVQIKAVKDVRLKSGPAVLVSYTSNSDPSPSRTSRSGSSTTAISCSRTDGWSASTCRRRSEPTTSTNGN